MADERVKLTHAQRNGKLQVVVRADNLKLVKRLMGTIPEHPPPGAVASILRRLQNAGVRFKVVGYIAAEKRVVINQDGYECGQLRSGDFIVNEDNLAAAAN